MSHTGATVQPFAYNGRDGVMDEGNSSYYLRARYFGLHLKRFYSKDSARSDSANKFALAKARPMSYVDPIGMWEWSDAFHGTSETLNEQVVSESEMVGSSGIVDRFVEGGTWAFGTTLRGAGLAKDVGVDITANIANLIQTSVVGGITYAMDKVSCLSATQFTPSEVAHYCDVKRQAFGDAYATNLAVYNSEGVRLAVDVISIAVDGKGLYDAGGKLLRTPGWASLWKASGTRFGSFGLKGQFAWDSLNLSRDIFKASTSGNQMLFGGK